MQHAGSKRRNTVQVAKRHFPHNLHSMEDLWTLILQVASSLSRKLITVSVLVSITSALPAIGDEGGDDATCSGPWLTIVSSLRGALERTAVEYRATVLFIDPDFKPSNCLGEDLSQTVFRDYIRNEKLRAEAQAEWLKQQGKTLDANGCKLTASSSEEGRILGVWLPREASKLEAKKCQEVLHAVATSPDFYVDTRNWK